MPGRPDRRPSSSDLESAPRGRSAPARDRPGRETPPDPDLLRAALPWQLRPHFLFNALHSIAALTQSCDHERAVRLVAALGDMLQRSLETRERDVRLRDESAFVRRYLDVEEARYGIPFSLVTELEGKAGRALVPGFLLQPIVEDLVRHTVRLEPKRSQLSIVARVLTARLDLEVRTRVSPEAEPVDFARTRFPGTEELRERLETRFGAAYRLALVFESCGSGVARLRLPYLAAPDAGSAFASSTFDGP